MLFCFDVPGRLRRGTAACVLLTGFALPATAQPTTTLYAGQSGTTLAASVRSGYTPTGTLGYNAARDQLFAYEQQTDGRLECIYTGYSVQLTAGADPSTDAYNKGINTEHTWPQSMGASAEPGRSDMHHLFPTRDNVNSARGSFPFDEIPDSQTDAWYRLAASQSSTPTSSLAEWSEKDNAHPSPSYTGRFEPRESKKGDIARAALYFYTIYQSGSNAAFFNVQKSVLLAWHAADPVDMEEYNRSEWIRTKQGKSNPFILDPSLASRIYGGGTPPPPTAGTLWINELHYDDYGTDAYEGVEIAGPAGTSLSGWKVIAYNGSGGAPYLTVSLSGSIDSEQNGYGAVWVAMAGLQNGAPDGVALVNPSGQSVQFLSYEGAFTATSGAASGKTSQDIGKSETSSTPDGYSLQLTGSGAGYSSFAWQAPRVASRGSLNSGQTISGSAGGGSTPPPAAPAAWINELHYDDYSTDSYEGVEVAGTAGLSLSGWKLVAYNGSGGADYQTLALSGSLPSQQGGFGTKWFAMSGLQNGGPDGIALIDAGGAVVQFLSYEGSFTATSGPASGRASQSISQSETSSTPNGHALQLGGTGSRYADFTWQAPRTATRGARNSGQTFGGPSLLAQQAASPLAIRLFPNPTAGEATVSVQVAETGRLTVAVYDVLGREVARLYEGAAEAGAEMRLALDARALPAGLYVVRAATAAGTATQRLTVTR